MTPAEDDDPAGPPSDAARRTSPSDPGAPLSDLVVVSMEQAIAIPFATRQLADLGATVLKVERPGIGDFARHYDGNVAGQSAFFVWANRGKHSVELDIKTERDRMEALIAGADVYLQNISPDAARRAGLDAEGVHQRHPHLVTCEVSGYGDGGPRSSDKAYDLAIQAEAGVFDVCGEGPMRAKVGFSVADIAAGMYAFSGVLAALVRRERTGHGAVVRVSMLEALAEWMSAPLLNARAVGATPPRTARRHFAIAPYGTFRLSDGTEVLLAIQNDAEWRRLCSTVLADDAVADDDRFVTNPRRIANVDALEDLMHERFAAMDPGQVRARLAEADLAVASVNTLQDVWDHEQLRARGRFVDTQLPGGATVETIRPPFDIDGLVYGPSWVPALGEDRRAP
jgi:formyl-CoA transferase